MLSSRAQTLTILSTLPLLAACALPSLRDTRSTIPKQDHQQSLHERANKLLAPFAARDLGLVVDSTILPPPEICSRVILGLSSTERGQLLRELAELSPSKSHFSNPALADLMALVAHRSHTTNEFVAGIKTLGVSAALHSTSPTLSESAAWVVLSDTVITPHQERICAAPRSDTELRGLLCSLRESLATLPEPVSSARCVHDLQAVVTHLDCALRLHAYGKLGEITPELLAAKLRLGVRYGLLFRDTCTAEETALWQRASGLADHPAVPQVPHTRVTHSYIGQRQSAPRAWSLQELQQIEAELSVIERQLLPAHTIALSRGAFVVEREAGDGNAHAYALWGARSISIADSVFKAPLASPVSGPQMVSFPGEILAHELVHILENDSHWARDAITSRWGWRTHLNVQSVDSTTINLSGGKTLELADPSTAPRVGAGYYKRIDNSAYQFTRPEPFPPGFTPDDGPHHILTAIATSALTTRSLTPAGGYWRKFFVSLVGGLVSPIGAEAR